MRGEVRHYENGVPGFAHKVPRSANQTVDFHA